MKLPSLLMICIISLITACSAQKSKSTWNNTLDFKDGWEITNPASVGINEDSLYVLFNLLNETKHRDFRSLVVIKDGKLVVDEYFNGYWYTNIHDIRSAGKSVTSMLAGIAIEKGLFKRSDKVMSFFPEYAHLKNKSPEKFEITIEDLLVMSAGLATDDYDDDSPGAEMLMLVKDDFLKFVLELPMDYKPGERYAYSSATAFLLGAIIQKTSGQTLEDFGRTYLFHPLGINHFYWEKSPKGISTGMGNLYFQARDFAKLSQIMLEEGQWKGQQLIPKQWIEKSIQKRFDISDSDPYAHGYGFMWYLAQLEIKGQAIDFYFASGNGGNKIFIIPSLNMTVTTLSSAYGQGYGHPRSHKILELVLQAALSPKD